MALSNKSLERFVVAHDLKLVCASIYDLVVHINKVLRSDYILS